LLLALRRALREAAAKAGVVRVHQQLLAGLGIAQGQQAQVGQGALQRVEQAHGQHLVAHGSCASGRSQPGSLMKSDTTNTLERRWMRWPAACSSSARRVLAGAWAAARAGRCMTACSSCSTWARLARAAITCSTPRRTAARPRGCRGA
jgi:hypothetical protein